MTTKLISLMLVIAGIIHVLPLVAKVVVADVLALICLIVGIATYVLSGPGIRS
jgi:hypothetical protein